MRGTRAHTIAKYFAYHPMYMENNLSLHPVLSRFYAGTYAKSDLDVLSDCVRAIQKDELRVVQFQNEMERISTDLCEGK